MSHHLCVIGPTMCGKSNLVKWLACEFRRRGIRVLLCDPVGDPAWKAYADFITDDPFALLAKAQASRRCFIILDEAGEYLLNTAKAEPLKWFIRRSRHCGHVVAVLAQKATDIHPTYRRNSGTLFLFGCGDPEAQTAVSDFTDTALSLGTKLPRFWYLMKPRFAPVVIGKTPKMGAGFKRRKTPPQLTQK